MRSGSAILSVLIVAACGSGAEQAVFIERLGNDTMAIESFTRHADRLEGRLLWRQPATRVATWTAELDADGRITRLAGTIAAPDDGAGGPPPQHAEAVLDGDSVRVTLHGARADTFSVEVPEGTVLSLPRTPVPIAFVEHVTRRWAAAGDSAYPMAFYGIGGRRVQTNAVTRLSDGAVALDFFGRPLVVEIAEDGAVHHLSGARTTMQVQVERVPAGSVNFDSLAGVFARRDAEGTGLGVASPRDTVELASGGVTFTVDYSRPARRGRAIWGGLVPFDTIWRTGANAATHFITSRNVRIGDAHVPAGSYTLWTTFTRDSGRLHINRQTGIWGTAYDASADLVTVPLTREVLDEAVERFTITIEPAARGGVLRLAWDDVAWTVPMLRR